MGWWGKLLGGAFGFMLGGPLGAVLGAALGHQVDKGLGTLDRQEGPRPSPREQVQTAFFTATFSVMGHLAKADGRVSADEIALAEAVMGQMDLSPGMRRTAIRLFREGKAREFPLDEVLGQLRGIAHRRTDLIRVFLEIQLQAAYADGALSAEEERLLLRMCRILGFPEAGFRQLEAWIRAERVQARGGEGEGVFGLEEAYAVLGVAPDASDEAIKTAYRRLRSQHHPDKLVAKGLPEEMMSLAARKSHEIRQAYERIRLERGG